MSVVYLSYYLFTTRLFLLVLRESLRPRSIHASRRVYALTEHSSFTASRYPSFQACKTPRRSAKHDSCVPTNYCDIVVRTFMMFGCVAERPCY